MMPILFNVSSLMLCTTLGIACIIDDNVIGASVQFFFAGMSAATIIFLLILRKP